MPSESKLLRKDVASSSALMEINGLDYSLPAMLSLTESGSVYKQNFADNQSYTSSQGSDIIFTLNASTDSVYGPNSYLRLDVKADGLVTAAGDNLALGFLNTPATALFDQFLLESKDGSELERIQRLGVAVRNILPWKYPQDYRRTVTMAGQFPDESPRTEATPSEETLRHSVTSAAVGTGSYLRVCIPLWYFSGLFAQEQLIPPQLISGLRFRLSLAPALRAFSIVSSAAGTVPAGYDQSALSYTIRDPVIVLDTYSLAPTIQRNVMEMMSRKQGVPYVYETLYNQTSNPDTSLEEVLQINKSVARAQKIYTITQNTIADTATIDNLGTKQFPYYQLQHRVGDWYAPQQQLQCGSTDTLLGVQKNSAEVFINNLQCVGGIRYPHRPVSVSGDTFVEFFG